MTDLEAPPSDSELDDELDELDDASPASPPPPFAPVETLVAGRARRSTAGNLLARLLTQEADEEDTLFLEDEDDVEFRFKEGEEPEDFALESSSSDDEDAANGRDDDDNEERALLQQEKEERRQKRRKADDAFLKPPPKKKRATVVKEAGEVEEGGEDGGEELALTRPRKKSERISWVPEFVATRASSRTLSLQNRETTMKRLEESEKRRLHTIALMEAAAKKKKKKRPRTEMTQEERLAEAKITEARNRKSLNSWERMEREKIEEQRRKLAALQNRKLAGPVITYWSGRAEWDPNGKLYRVGKGLIEEIHEDGDGKKKKKVVKNAVKDSDATSSSKPTAPSTPQLQPTEPSAASTTPTQPPPSTPRLPPPLENGDIPLFLDGILDYANPPPDSDTILVRTSPAPPAPPPGQQQQAQQPLLEISARSLIVLENFDSDAVRDKHSVMRTLCGAHIRRPQAQTIKPMCVITHQPAKFCDPATGMPYSSLHAYREIRRILRGEIRWSSLLGAYIGEAGIAASGVPEGF